MSKTSLTNDPPLLHKHSVSGSFIGRTITTGMMSSNTDMWATPQDFFDKINAEYNFNLDVCALPENAKCQKYFTPEIDGLKQDWNGTCWMNPPYGREIGKWVEKAYSALRLTLNIHGFCGFKRANVSTESG